MKNNKNLMMLQRTKKRRSRMGINPQKIGGRLGIPTRFPRPTGDIVPMTLRFAHNFASDASGNVSYLVVYGRGSSGAGYYFLDDYCPGFAAMVLAYSKFLIKRIKLNARPISNLTAGGFVGINYEATNSGIANPPTVLADVSNSVHYAGGTPGAPAELIVSPLDYTNDWRSTQSDSAGVPPFTTQMGVTQLFGTGLPASATTAVVVDFELEMYFCGYRV